MGREEELEYQERCADMDRLRDIDNSPQRDRDQKMDLKYREKNTQKIIIRGPSGSSRNRVVDNAVSEAIKKWDKR